MSSDKFTTWHTAGEGGKESTGEQGKSAVKVGELGREVCGAQSSKVYCMEVTAMEFQEADMVQHTLGSTCASLHVHRTRLRTIGISNCTSSQAPMMLGEFQMHEKSGCGKPGVSCSISMLPDPMHACSEVIRA